MNNLYLLLIIAGALIIIAVLIVNWWQERRFHRQVEDSFSPIKNDALLDDALPSSALPVEPNFSEPSLDSKNASNIKNKHAADDFKIDSVLLESARSEPSFSDQNDRYVKLTQNFGDEADLPQEVSIETAYNDIINTKLERLSTHEFAHESPHKPDVVDTTQSNAKVREVKEIFNDIPSAIQQNEPENLASPQDEDLNLPAMLHGQMDLTAVLYLSTPISINTLNNALNTLFDGIDKPVFIHALHANNHWHLLQDVDHNSVQNFGKVAKVACSLQLADRGGAVSRNALNRFQLGVETLGLAINSQIEWQSAEDALAKANALDAFCIEVDKTIGFHLVHGENGAFTGTKLRGLAESQGFTLGSDGEFKYVDEALKTTSFVMFNREDYPFSLEMLRSSVVKAVTFQLDIPRVKQCAEVFIQMVQVARQMEVGLHAVLVDDNNKVLGDIQIEKIRQQLKVIQATMLVRGIVPGSESARRLFS